MKAQPAVDPVNKTNLIRYDVSTDLELFNASRPGSQYDDEDLKFIQQNSTNSFVDARFYPDYQFIKLADELKSKFFDANLATVPKTSKPVNVVGPMLENKGAKLPTETKISAPQMNKYEQKIEYLENQLKGIHEHLQIQTQVNAELKKLLVASMGEDIQYKIERLVSDKERLTYEVSKNRDTISKLNEEVEQFSIKCDLWRSKFLACRLMSDEASTWKSFLLLLNKQNEKVLKNLLNDNEMLNQKLNQALELLNQSNSDNNVYIKRNHNNFQAVNLLLLGLDRTQKRAANTSQDNIPMPKIPSLILKTDNEAIGGQMLEQFNWVNLAMNEVNPVPQPVSKVGANPDEAFSYVDNFEKLEQLIDRVKKSRSTIHSRLFQTTDMGDFDLMLNVCNICNGKIQHI